MALRKIVIENFKGFEGRFSLELKDGINILVGDNGAGKSTILEAIHLALTGLYNGKHITNCLSQYLFNNMTVANYLQSIQNGTPIAPPTIRVELYFNKPINAELFEGNYNTDNVAGAEGLQIEIAYNNMYDEEYKKIIENKELASLPIEYYDVSWTTFARRTITPKSIPVKVAMIDSSNYRYQNGSDVYISRITKECLTPEDTLIVAQAHRKMLSDFASDKSITDINQKISETAAVDKGISLAVNLGAKNAWEGSLTTKVDNVPFNFIGRGLQCIIKTKLAINHKRARDCNVVLMEEPESHLSFAGLSQLISGITDNNEEKQFIISTHSSFVANKLGLNSLFLLSQYGTANFTDMSVETTGFFKRIAGYDTLRLVLSQKAILVEGDSDELIVQKAYMLRHNGHLPIQDGIDVISVGTSFLRFLEIGKLLKKTIAVVTDNDSHPEALNKKYAGYLNSNADQNNSIAIFFDPDIDTGDLEISGKPYNYNTLEPKLLKVNSLKLFNEIFKTTYSTEDELRRYMQSHKTECALAIFETGKDVQFPEYIIRAIRHVE